MHLLFGLVLFVVIMVFTAILFVLWVTIMVVKGIIHLFVGKPSPRPPLVLAAPQVAAMERVCARDRCHTLNPSAARFCRRCGAPLRLAPVQMTPRLAI